MEFIESERGNQKLNIKLKKNCSRGAIVREAIVLGGQLSGSLLSGGYFPGGYCPAPKQTCLVFIYYYSNDIHPAFQFPITMKHVFQQDINNCHFNMCKLKYNSKNGCP
jgi:hypothetical protein